MAVKEELEGLLTPFLFLGVYLTFGALCCWLTYGLGREQEAVKSANYRQEMRTKAFEERVWLDKNWKSEIVKKGFATWEVKHGEIIFVWAGSDDE